MQKTSRLLITYLFSIVTFILLFITTEDMRNFKTVEINICLKEPEVFGAPKSAIPCEISKPFRLRSSFDHVFLLHYATRRSDSTRT